VSKRVLAFFVFAAWLLLADLAWANGRFPNAQQLVVHPTNRDRLWLRATHGVLTSADRGQTWRWVCETAIGYSGTSDPAFAVTATGKVLVGLNGLTTSSDEGCDWVRDPTFDGQSVVDLSVDKADPNRVILLTSVPGDGGTYVTAIWRSRDGAGSWTQLPGAIDPNLVAETLDAAPSDPTRLYVTGLVWSTGDAGTTNSGKIYVSKDDGATFESYPLPGARFLHAPFLAAVHPTNPDVLYVRVRGPDLSPPSSGTVENFLLYSDDGGKTFEEILRAPADFLGFALAPDGATVLVGMGDSAMPGGLRGVDRSALGLYSSPAPNHAFTRLSEGHIGGLTFDAEELYACTSEFQQKYEVMRSADRGRTLEGLTVLANVDGPVICPCDTPTGATCPGEWPRMCGAGFLNRCSGASDPKALAYCGDAPPPPPAPPPPDDGCGCRTPSRGSTISAALAIFTLAGIPLLRRRRRR
jgi:MYXO-CTERM domain-containing protein